MFKSIKTGILAAILISSAIIAHAQKKLTEGTISYTAEYAPTAEQEAAVSMLPVEFKTKFSGNLSKMSFENGPASIAVIFDLASSESLTLIDVPVAQMQFAIKGSKADYEKTLASEPKFVDFKATGEKKMINNYNSEKYSYKDDKGGAYELWVTNDIELPSGIAGPQFKDIKGAILKYTTFQRGIKSTLSVKNIAEEKVEPISLTVPDGYEVKTMEEIMAMQGGGE